MTEVEYARTTWVTFNYKVEGYFKKHLEEWRRTRFIGYNIYLSIPKKEGTQNDSIFEYYPLPNDPTGKQLEKYRLSEKKLGDKNWQALKKMYEKSGLLKDGKIIYN